MYRLHRYNLQYFGERISEFSFRIHIQWSMNVLMNFLWNNVFFFILFLAYTAELNRLNDVYIILRILIFRLVVM